MPFGMYWHLHKYRCTTHRGAAQPPAQEKAPSQVVSHAKATVFFCEQKSRQKEFATVIVVMLLVC